MDQNRRRVLKQGGILAGLASGAMLLPKTAMAGTSTSAIAANDMIVYGNIICTDGARGTFTGSAGGPTNKTILTRSSAQLRVSYDRRCEKSAFMMPVKAGQSFTLDTTEISSPFFNIIQYSLPPVPNGLFGDMIELSVPQNTHYRLPVQSDGLLMVMMHENWDGNRGQATLHANGMLRAACSMHVWTGNDVRYPTTSFCAPIRAGEEYTLFLTATSGRPFVNVFWLPFKKNVLGPLQIMRPEDRPVSGTVGFAVAVLHAAVNGHRGEVGVHFANRTISTSVHYYTNNDCWIPYNTATVPIPANMAFNFSKTPTSGDPATTFYWMPMYL